MPTIHANGLDIAYERPGEGPPLLLLHGATGSGRDHFAPILPSLATRFTVFAPDARSHAGTRFRPVEVRCPETRRVAWCGCKRTRTPPFCDGSHARA